MEFFYDDKSCIENPRTSAFFSYNKVTEKQGLFINHIANSNYGYYIPVSNKTFSSNTYTFIHKKNKDCNIFIAPISHKKLFTKKFFTYEKYKKKMETRYRRLYYENAGARNEDMSLCIFRKNDEEVTQDEYEKKTLKRSNTMSSIQYIMQIFDTPNVYRSSVINIPIPAENFMQVTPIEQILTGSPPIEDDFDIESFFI